MSQSAGRWMTRGLMAYVLLWSALQTWNGRHATSPDAISYLDIARQYAAGDLSGAVNTYWSPLYSWLVALLFRAVSPDAGSELPYVHLLNFVIYLLCLWSYLFAAREVRRTASESGLNSLSLQTWEACSIAIFAACTLGVFILRLNTPDLLAGALFFLAAGWTLRNVRSGGSVSGWLVLGIVLGSMYLAKTAMLVSAGILLASAVFWNRDRARPFHLAICVASFVLVVAPWVGLVSAKAHKLTIGEAGRLNYAFLVNQSPFLPWGQPDTPDAPGAQRLLPELPLYRYSIIPGATFAPWYEPPRWHAGANSRLGPYLQYRAIRRNVLLLGMMVMTAQLGLVVGFGFLLWRNGGLTSWLSALREYAVLVPVITVSLGVYLLIFVEGRYLFPFLALGWLLLLAALGKVTDRQAWLATWSSVVLLTGYLAYKEMQFVKYAAPEHQQRVEAAKALGEHGIRGWPIALLEMTMEPTVAHLAGISVAVQPTRAWEWERLEPTEQMQVLEASRQAGARAILLRAETPIKDPQWVRLGATKYYLYKPRAGEVSR